MPEVGDTIRIKRIKYMKDGPQYNGKEGVITRIDEFGQLFGSWGNLAIMQDIDEFEIIKKG